MNTKRTCLLCLFVLGCLLVNCLGKFLASLWQLPIWLDAMGTIGAGYALGPVCGALVGATTNLLYGIFVPHALSYALTSAIIGALVGVIAKKGLFKDLFSFLSSAFALTIASVAISTPLNFALSGGSVGNIWGDGIVSLFRELGIPSFACIIAGEFYIDFLDKTLAMLLLFAVVSLLRKHRGEPPLARDMRKPRSKTPPASLSLALAALLAGSLACPMGISDARAAQTDASSQAIASGNQFDKYIRKVYNGSNGLRGGMVNDIVQTKDGVLWIGSYSGLYRYYGSNFEWMSGLTPIKTVNCLFTDEAGRLWIGTNDNGLAILINGEISNQLTKKDGFPSNSVRCITEGPNGFYYAGTTDSLVVITISGGMRVYDTISEVRYAKRIAASPSGMIAAVTDEGALYLIKGTEVVAKRLPSDPDAAYTSCIFDNEGRLYTGTAQGVVEEFDISKEELRKLASTPCEGLADLSSLVFSDDGQLYVCAENGAGRLDAKRCFTRIDLASFNSSIEHMLIDYQGNLWFTSSRLGLLSLCKSAFTEIGEPEGLSGNVVNTAARFNGVLYFGTDSGLETTRSERNQAGSALIERLDGVRIRCLMVDSVNTLWICTSGEGLWAVSPKGRIKCYDSASGTAGDKFRSVIETRDKTIVAAGDYGITYIKRGKVAMTTSTKQGLSNPKVLTLVERGDGAIIAGTDGGGVAVVESGRVAKTVTQENGLSSGIILRITADSSGNGFFVVTGNGLCYVDGNNDIRILDNFPYYNNYDVIEGDNGELFVPSSAGIFVVSKSELLAGGQLNYLLLDSKKGLRMALTPNSWNYRDENENLVLAADTGAVRFNLNEYNTPVRSYRVLLTEIGGDGQRFAVEKDVPTTIPSGISQISISPQIVNYSINDPNISYYLDGVDTEAHVVAQSELADITYTNISPGKHAFHLAVIDGRTGETITESVFELAKEQEFCDFWWFRLYAALVAAAAVAYLTWLVIRTQIQKTLAMQRMELDFAKNQIKMSNETILTIARTVDAKDENTSQHSERVAEYSVLIARELGYSQDECETLRKIALLHDIGKIGIPDSVLNKPGRLTDEEYAIMKSHVVKGAEILKNFTIIDNVADGALYHHERYDGRGYVNGLEGEEIPLNARIIGIADAFDAMTANRVYRKKLDFDFVLGELEKGKGTQFDPQLVDIMLKLIERGDIDVAAIYARQ